jgi:hypothetical protein
LVLEFVLRNSPHETRCIVSVSYVGNLVPNNLENNNINQISPAWNAQCDVERGGNRQRSATALPARSPTHSWVSLLSPVQTITTPRPFPSPTLTRPYPLFGDITENGATNNGKNWYNALSVVGSHQLSGSLSVHATYTHAKAEAIGYWVPGANTWGPPGTNPTTGSGWVDQLNNVMSREVSTFADVKHSVTLSGVAVLPFGRNRLLLSNVNRVVDEIVNGWEITPLYTYYSGFAWRPTQSGGSGEPYDQAGNWEMASGGPVSQSMGVNHTILAPDGQHNYSRIRGVTPCVGYKNTDTGAIIPSPAATAAGCSAIQFVRAPNSYAVGQRNVDFGVRQPGAYKLDIAASKNFSIPEASRIYLGDQAKLQIRVDFLNAFNHANWDNSYNNDPTSINFGTIRKGPDGPSNEPRYLQLSGKLTW